MRQLFKTTDVINFLVNLECHETADDMYTKANGAEFMASSFVKDLLIRELYEELVRTNPQYTYVK